MFAASSGWVKRAWVAMVVVPLGLAAGGCGMSPQQELELGRRLHPEFERKFGGLYPDQGVQQYVSDVGLDLARRSGRPGMDWRFRVLNSDQVNAFALPGGYVYITQGLLFRLSNEAQLAGVLGHEAAHVSLRHAARQMERAQLAQGGLALLGIFGGSQIADVGALVAQLALMKYGRDQEREADLAGLGYMATAGYNPEGMVQTMEVLQRSGGGRGPPEFFSTHPDPGSRREYLMAAIEGRYEDAARTASYGERSFRQHVLEGRPPRRAAANLPAGWCAACADGS